jgi:hypothetical protein
MSSASGISTFLAAAVAAGSQRELLLLYMLSERLPVFIMFVYVCSAFCNASDSTVAVSSVGSMTCKSVITAMRTVARAAQHRAVQGLCQDSPTHSCAVSCDQRQILLKHYAPEIVVLRNVQFMFEHWQLHWQYLRNCCCFNLY